jgi:hypothetical protein
LASDERNERKGADVLIGDRLLIAGERGIGGDVGDDDRLRVGSVWCPRRVAFDGGAIGCGQPSPCLEAHHVVGVEEQHRRARGVQRVRQCIQ